MLHLSVLIFFALLNFTPIIAVDPTPQTPPSTLPTTTSTTTTTTTTTVAPATSVSKNLTDAPQILSTVTTTDLDSSDNDTFSQLPPIASKLIRFRRQPPLAIIKHVVRASKRTKPRRRIKHPKNKYGPLSPPPNYSYGESSYKSHYRKRPLSYDYDNFNFTPEKLGFGDEKSPFTSLNDFNLDAPDFGMPPSSYEAQSMDLDFYSHKKESKPTPKLEYSIDLEQRLPSYTYKSAKKEKSLPRKPHQKYGVPLEYDYPAKDTNNNNNKEMLYGDPENFSLPNYEAPEDEFYKTNPYDTPQATSYDEPASSYDRKPASKYSTPDVAYDNTNVNYGSAAAAYDDKSASSIYDQPSSSYDAPSFSIYDQAANIYNQHTSSNYDEQQPAVGYDPTPSAAYDHPVSTFDTAEKYTPTFHADIPAPQHNYNLPNLYEPPVPRQSPPEVHTNFQATNPNNNDNYGIYNKKIPNANYKTKGRQRKPTPPTDFDITYSPSYEIQIPPDNQDAPSPGNFAEPPPFPRPTKQTSDYSSNINGGGHKTNSKQQRPTHYASDYTTDPLRPTYSQPDYVSPPSEELPLNTNPKHPTYDTPKSSYEVPIYDPIPFESSNTNDQRELFPPHASFDIITPQNSLNQPTDFTAESVDVDFDINNEDTKPQGSTKYTATDLDNQDVSSIRNKRKRYRGGAQSVTTRTKHVLNAPEFIATFEQNKRYKKQNHDDDHDTTVNESNKIENKRHYTTTSNTTRTSAKENFANPSWNPMRVRNPTRFSSSRTGGSDGLGGGGGSNIQTQQQYPTSKTTTSAAITTSAKSTNTRQHILSRRRQQQQRRLGPNTTARPPQPTKVTTNISLRQPTTQNINNDPHVTIFAIEKSRSQNYYDGTMVPPILTMPNLYNNRFNSFKMPTYSPAITLSPKDVTSKRTTKSILETTYFKSPKNDRERQRQLSYLEQPLPKNHKLF